MKQIYWEKLNYAKLTEEQKDSIINTPLGIFNINEVTNQFNLWIGHTNFKLTTGFLKNVRNIVGVESFNDISPIRFVVSIGKLFNEENVKREIEDIVKEDEFFELKNSLQKYDDWAIYQFPNGQFEVTHSKKKDFSKKLNEFNEMKLDIGGKLIRPQ